MRTKHLLYTLALAGAFTACTQDEFVTDNGNDALVGRKSLGKITFVRGGADTRWAVEGFNAIKPEEGDGFSLMLVDEPRQGLSGQHLYPYDNYRLVNSIYTNYVFKKNGNGWDSEANLVEGNYLFVAPAQETLDRKPVEITLPTEQNLKLDADGEVDGLSAIKEFAESGYPFYVGHRFLSEEGANREELPAMQHIFSYPLITVKNSDRDNKKPAILTKVIIKQNNADKAFVINAPLNNVNAAKTLTNEWFAKRGEDTKDRVVVGDWAGHMTKNFGAWTQQSPSWTPILQEWKDNGDVVEIPENVNYIAKNSETRNVLGNYMYNNGLFGETADLIGDPQSKSQYIVINMPGNGVEVKYGEPISFNAIIPAAEYVMEDNEMVIYAVLANGEAYQKVMKSNTLVQMYPGKRYPNQDYTGLTPKGDKGLYFTIDVNDGASDGLSTYKKIAASTIGGVATVNSTDELIAAIKKHTSTEALNITVGKGVVYNNEVNKALANTSCQDVRIQGNIKVAGPMDKAIDSRVSFEDVVIEKGVVEFNSDKATLGKVFVAPGATLKLNGVKENNNSEIYNAGTLVLSVTEFGSVENYGELKVATDVTGENGNIENRYAACVDYQEILSPSIKLTPSVEILAGGKYGVSGNIDYPITVNAKAGQKAAGELVLNDNAAIVEKGNIINNGVVNGNNAELTVTAGREMTVNAQGKVECKVVIEAGTTGFPVDTWEYEEAAKVVNNGEMAEVVVGGLLKMGNSNARVKTVTAADAVSINGGIDNTAKGILEAKTVDAAIPVFATISSLTLTGDKEEMDALKAELKSYATTARKVNTLRLNGKLNITGTGTVMLNKADLGNAITTLEFMPGSSLNIGEATFSSDLNITVKAAKIEWSGVTEATSKFSLRGTKTTKQTYVDVNGDGKMNLLDGSVDFKNCQAVKGL